MHPEDIIRQVQLLFPNAGLRGSGFSSSTIKTLLRIESRAQRRVRTNETGRFCNTAIANSDGEAMANLTAREQRRAG